MKRFAAHYIYFSTSEYYKLHYIELDENCYIRGVFPLESEIAGTSFFNGTIIVVNTDTEFNINHLPENQIDLSKPVVLYHSAINLLSPEFSTGNSRGDSYIQRLC